MTIGQRIKTKREALGMSQDELARKLGYKDRSSINKIEKDIRNLTQSKIKAIADALETTPAFIMGWQDEDGNYQIRTSITDAHKHNANEVSVYVNQLEYALLEAFRNAKPSHQETILDLLNVPMKKDSALSDKVG